MGIFFGRVGTWNLNKHYSIRNPASSQKREKGRQGRPFRLFTESLILMTETSWNIFEFWHSFLADFSAAKTETGLELGEVVQVNTNCAHPKLNHVPGRSVELGSISLVFLRIQVAYERGSEFRSKHLSEHRLQGGDFGSCDFGGFWVG